MTERNLDVIRLGPEDRAITVLPEARRGAARMLLPVQAAGAIPGDLVAELLADRGDDGQILRDSRGRIQVDTQALSVLTDSIIENPFLAGSPEDAKLLYTTETQDLFPGLLKEISTKDQLSRLAAEAPTLTGLLQETISTIGDVESSKEAQLFLDLIVTVARQQFTQIRGFQVSQLRDLSAEAYKVVKMLVPFSEEASKKALDTEARDREDRGFRVLGSFVTNIAVANGVDEAVEDRSTRSSTLSAFVSRKIDFDGRTAAERREDELILSAAEKQKITQMDRASEEIDRLASSLEGRTTAPIGELRSTANGLGSRAKGLKDLRDHAGALGGDTMFGTRLANAYGDDMEKIRDKSE